MSILQRLTATAPAERVEPAEPAERVRVRLDLGYDGTDFAGWAAQPAQRTVAGVLQQSLELLIGAGGAVGLTCAGRTDAGVHATGQVCHVELNAQRWQRCGPSLVTRLAGLLPADLRVYSAIEVPASFDARFSALFRRYAYRVSDLPWGASPLRHRDTLAWPRPLDLAALQNAGQPLVGEHDFAAYCRRRDYASTIRTVLELSWRREPDGVLVAVVAADAFCQAMVRSLVGALLAVGDGRREPAWPATLLERRSRASEVMVAPPHGLTLVAVEYPTEASQYALRAAATRQRRG